MFNFNSTFIAQMINFLLLLFILKKVAYKPLLTMMEERRNRIKNDLAKAEADKLAASNMKAEYEKQLSEVRAEAQSILATANKMATETKDEILTQARAEQERLITSARDQIKREQQKAMADIRKDIAGLVMLATTQIIGKNMTDKIDNSVIENVLNSVDDTNGGLPC